MMHLSLDELQHMWLVATVQDSTDTKHKSDTQTLPKRGRLNRRLTAKGNRSLQRKHNKNELRRYRGLLWRWHIEREIRDSESVHVVKTVCVYCGQEADEKPSSKTLRVYINSEYTP